MAPSRDAIERSLSWRITAPLRWLGKPITPLLQRLAARPFATSSEHDGTAPAQLAASLAAVRGGAEGIPLTTMADLSPEEARLCVARWHDLTVLLGERTPEWVYQAMTVAMQSNPHDYGEAPEARQIRGDIHKHDLLRSLHARLRPRAYLEIGVERGFSLCLAQCPAVGVDPAPHIAQAELPVWTRLVVQGSDAFFAGDARTLLQPPPELVFIDGMHLFESVLRDFANVERHATPSTLVVIDDIFPNHPIQALRHRRSGAWTGDVWKVVETLRRLRPDLLLLTLDSQGTGLLLVAGLDPDRQGFAGQINSLPIDPDRPPPESVLRRDGALPSDHPAVFQLVDCLHRTARIQASVAEVGAELARRTWP